MGRTKFIIYFTYHPKTTPSKALDRYVSQRRQAVGVSISIILTSSSIHLLKFHHNKPEPPAIQDLFLRSPRRRRRTPATSQPSKLANGLQHRPRPSQRSAPIPLTGCLLVHPSLPSTPVNDRSVCSIVELIIYDNEKEPHAGEQLS